MSDQAPNPETEPKTAAAQSEGAPAPTQSSDAETASSADAPAGQASANVPTQAAPDPQQPVDVPPESPAAESTAPTEKPELLVGAAFAGGLLLATILKRLAR